MLKAWMLEHTQRLLHRAQHSALVSPQECICMRFPPVLRAALTRGPQLRYFRGLFTLLASEIPFQKNGSVSGCPQRGLCFSSACVLMRVCVHVTATRVPWYKWGESKGFLNTQLSHTHFLYMLICVYVLTYAYSLHVHARRLCIFVFVYIMWRFRQSPMTLYVKDPACLVKVSNL